MLKLVNYLLLRNLFKNMTIIVNQPIIKVSPPNGVTNQIDFAVIDVK